MIRLWTQLSEFPGELADPGSPGRTPTKTNLQPEYLSEEYLAILSDLVAEMQRRGMKLWLYDEGGWPSGGNCGRIVREHPAWARQTLVKRDVAPGELARVPDDCIAAFQAGGNGGGRRLGPGERLDAGQGAELYSPNSGTRRPSSPPTRTC